MTICGGDDGNPYYAAELDQGRKVVSMLVLIMVMLVMEIFNSLWPSDAIWPQKSRSTLAQVMACCLTAPSHYLNPC